MPKLFVDFGGGEERNRCCGNCGNREVIGHSSYCSIDNEYTTYAECDTGWCRRWKRNRAFDNLPEAECAIVEKEK